MGLGDGRRVLDENCVFAKLTQFRGSDDSFADRSSTYGSLGGAGIWRGRRGEG